MDEPRTTSAPTDASPTLPDIPTAMTPIDPPPNGDRQRRGSGIGRVLATGAAMVVLGFGGGVAGFYAADNWWDDETQTAGSSVPVQPTNDSPGAETTRTRASSADGELTPRQIYERVAPAVVHIDARIVEQGSFFGIPTTPQEAVGTGSGFVIDDEGHVVTNAHVVEDAQELRVNFGDDKSVPARVIGMDNSTDVAVIKIDPDEVKDLEGGLKTVPFGDPGDLRVGDPVVAIGNPFRLDRTLTTGVVSALQRDIPALNDFAIRDVIQTDAAVNPGNSGGPLLNMRGEVIGVNSQIKSQGGGFDGIAFAVPSTTVKRVAEALIKDGSVEYAWLGVSGRELTDEMRDKLKLKDGQQGVAIFSVVQGSPAARAGLEGGPNDETPGDIVLSFDGKQLDSMTELSDLVDARKPKDKVKVVVLRKGKRETLTVTLGERPNEVSSRSEG